MHRTVNTAIVLIFSVLIAAGSAQAAGGGAETLNIMSFNIRYDNPGDGENAWPNRPDKAAGMIRFHQADICGVQEALRHQLDDLAERLPEYAWFGVGRDDGKDAGEFMAVFYRKDRLELLEKDTFWLSETPEKPGIGWDAACNRVVTWGQFRDKQTGKTFYHFNTHFDHKGPKARRESANLLLERIASIAGSSPLTVTGDFNATPDSEPITVITGGIAGKPGTKLIDTRIVSRTPHHGPSGTWSGFENAGKQGDQPIDYVFIKNGVSVLRHGTLSDTFDGFFPSDHMPVLVETALP